MSATMSGNNVAWAVKRLRESKNMSARQLSLKSGLSPSYVAKLESGEIEPSFRAFAKIALVLEMSILEISFCIIGESLDGKRSFHNPSEHNISVDELQPAG